MSILSDVGVAIKKPRLDQLPADVLELLQHADERRDHDAGTLFVFRSMKWYLDSVPAIRRLYEEVRKHPGDFAICEACYDYPTAGNDAGSWDDNPWHLGVDTSVSLCFEGTG